MHSKRKLLGFTFLGNFGLQSVNPSPAKIFKGIKFKLLLENPFIFLKFNTM